MDTKMSQKESYSAVLRDLREKRARLGARLARLDSAISAIEEEAREVAPAPSGNGAAGSEWTGVFAELSITDAARKYLEMQGKAKSGREIWNALEEGGVTTSSQDPVNNLNSILNKSHDFGRSGRGKWKLAQWPDEPPETADGGNW